MNFGAIGFIFITIFSGFIFGTIFNYAVAFEKSILHTALYSMLAFGGAPALSNMGVVNLLTMLVFGSVICFLSKIKLNLK